MSKPTYSFAEFLMLTGLVDSGMELWILDDLFQQDKKRYPLIDVEIMHKALIWKKKELAL